ncbi:MAG TPA: hypothetical protein VF423_07070 [Actinomycetes bacterium]
MTLTRHVAPAAAAALCVALAAAVGTGGPASGAGRTLPGTECPVFPATSYWHADVSALPVHDRSDQWMSNMSEDRDLHPDFGPSYGAQPVPYGIPITVVGGTHPKVRVRFDYADESDRVRYPLGSDTRIEGGRAADGDRHALVVDRGSCRLYETFATRQTSTGRWRAGSGATWRLTSNALRPDGWTSADAAGLPILPGLLRLGEVRRGHVDHAIRFTTNVTDRSHVWPARHDAGSVSNPAYPPMGAWFRLSASFPVSSFRPDTRVVLRAMQRHGLVLADNGSPWYFQGTASAKWPSGLLDELKSVPASAFEAVDTSSLRASPDSGRVRGG